MALHRCVLLAKSLGPSRKGGLLDLYRFCGLVIRVQNSDFRDIAMGGAVNFCLQKSKMPLAGLGYFW